MDSSPTRRCRVATAAANYLARPAGASGVEASPAARSLHDRSLMRAATGSLERIEEQPDRLNFEISVDDSVIAEVSNATWSDAVWFFNHYSGELHRGALSSAHRVDLRVGGRVTAATEVSVGRSSPIGLSSSGGL